MRCLIRFLTRSAAGAVESRERWFDDDVLTLGRGSDQVIYVRDRRVALEHARITRRGSDIAVTALTPAGVVVNGAVVRDARLGVGDSLQLGENLLKVLPPPAGADLALSFELDPAVRAADAGFRPAGLRLGDYGLGMRAWSWLLVVLALLLGLLLPASGLLDRQWQQQLRATALPSDGAWTPGPLATVHAVTASNCEACHQQPFVRVRDTACLDCHRPSLHQHAPGFTRIAAAEDRAQCTDCHRDHDGDAALVSRDDGTCAACHRNLKVTGGTGITAVDASDFLTDHPPFRVTNLLVVQGDAATPAPTGKAAGNAPGAAATGAAARNGVQPFVIRSRRAVPGAALAASTAAGPRAGSSPARPSPRPATARSLDEAPPSDAALHDGSGLIFPHDEHLSADGIRSPEGTRVLACVDCHRADGEGGFRPLAMERDCADCHRLDFDPADPERSVPHGKPQAVADMLVEYYSARYLEGFEGALPLPGDRPRPGRVPSAADRALDLERARQRAANATRDVIERRVCVTCHVVDRISAGGATPTWLVRPVALTDRWMPEARFDHERHGTSLTPCKTCHEAERSRDARDILMPVIADCRACHAGSDIPRGQPNLVASGCMSCHGFHRATAPLWASP